ncbi:hypothetical protein ACFC4G_43680 [Streptomyces sp. NPDC056002]|uniref:hypothetical protein n=1 Tax=Streptomyces sp. NPDC056002 TaxID=3345675 RepID=UPI0035DEFF52
MDMWVIRDDGERWSGTVATLDELHRVMDRRRQAGGPEGNYWWCWDGLIVRDPGVLSMAKVVDGIVASGEHETAFPHIDPEEDIWAEGTRPDHAERQWYHMCCTRNSRAHLR